MIIDFKTAYRREPMTGSIFFSATVEGGKVRNSITENTLVDCFDRNDDEDTPLVFERNRAAIETKVREKIQAGKVNESGGADLTPSDFE